MTDHTQRILKALLIEDSEDDALLTLRSLRRAGFEVLHTRVDSENGLLEAIESGKWEVILTDVVIPDFGGLAALQILRLHGIETPVIVVSGAVGEEQAAGLMRAGARDFVHKANLSRLGPVVERELNETELRRQQRAAEEALALSEERHRTLVASLPVGVFRAGQGGVIVSANPSLAAMFGYESEESLVSSRTSDYVVENERVRQMAEAALSEVVERELEFRRRDGSTFWGIVRLRAEHGPDGEVTGVNGTLVDTTRRRQLETAIRLGKEEWERTFDAVRELIIITDPFLTVVRMNRALADRLGAGPRDLVGRNWTDLLGGPPPPVPLDRLIDARLRGGSIEYDYESEPLGGQFRFSATPRTDEKGVIVGAIHVGRDVTTQRQIEELLRRQAAVEQAEDIFRIFRHETGNALNTLKTTLTFFRESYERFGREQRDAYFLRCLESLGIAEGLLSSLRSYQTLDHVELRPLDVSELLARKEALLFTMARAQGIPCDLRLPDDGMHAWILGDPGALTRVLLNLIDNATAATAARPDPWIRVSCRNQTGSVCIEVEDNGRGIPGEALPHVFSPLFTTKAEGSGMGLAIVQKLMLRMNGFSSLTSVFGSGTRAQLRFPRLDATSIKEEA